MLKYLAGRGAQALFVVWAAYTVTFVILYALPSDPVEIKLSQGEGGIASPEKLAELRAQYGLDQPLWVQYLAQLGRLLTGDLGTSIATGAPVTESIVQALPHTIALASFALILSLVFGAGIALLAGYLRWPPAQHLLMALPPLGVSIPTFWSALVLLQIFSFQLGWFPATGNTGFASLVLPAVALALPNSAFIAQVLSRSLRTTLAQPYIETARARGAGRARVQHGHALRNAVIPAVTVVGITTGNLLGGAVVVETVFARQGIGRLTQSAVATQDIPMVQALVVLAAVIFVIVNLLVDLLYPLIDPRIAHAGEGTLTARRARRKEAVVV
ncbi:ABC transporter permease [Microbacterium trichothecenolyticum]|uniref:ABC transporter permease n=1 Tax=Microbacterium trichothecenolyticum TaxID=69370 RepID=UPI001C6E3A0E|nr:ABC transporter permease [Microbacterium trichothecenolyticum]